MSKGLGLMNKIEGLVDASYYIRILQEGLYDTIEKFIFDPIDVIFQYNNVGRHKAKII